MKTLTETEKKLKELLSGTSFDGYDYLGHDDADSLIESLREQINEDEIIYYSKAMQYLMDNDNSLHESMAIAHEFGYTTENLNSELLATLLYQQNLNNELSELESDIKEVYENTVEE